MRAAIRDPQRPITNDFLETLSLLEVQERGEYALPPFTDATRVAFNAARERKMAAFRSLVSQHMTELSAALLSKTSTAFAISVNTLLEAPPANADRTGLQQMLQSSWDTLPVRMRNELIMSRWKDIGGPGMLPILRQIVDAPPNLQAQGPERGPALTRIYELSADEGRELILREILNTKSDIGMDVLGLLPDRELPQIERPLLEKFATRPQPSSITSSSNVIVRQARSPR